MKTRFHLLLLTVALAFVSTTGCKGIFTSSQHTTEDYTPVFAAASAGNLEVVKAAVNKDKSVLKAREWDGTTLLHDAVGQNHLEVTAYLLDEGADVNAVAKGGVTPLHMAAQNGNLEMVKLLLAHKAKINAKDDKGRTPLVRAEKWKHPEVADYLRQQGGHE